MNITAGCFARGGNCITTGGTNSFGYLFPSNATSTTLTFSTGLLSLASTTIGNGNQNGGLTINGGATTTGNAYFAGDLGIGTTSSPSVLTVAPTSAQLVSKVPVLLLGTSTFSTIMASSQGTYIGLNAPQSFNGNFLDFQLAGGPQFTVSTTSIFLVTGPDNSITMKANDFTSDIGFSLHTRDTGSITGGPLSLYAGNGSTFYGPNGNDVFVYGGAAASGGRNGNVILADTGSVSQGNVGIGTTTPWAQLSLAGAAGGTVPLLSISSSTSGFATTTVFQIDKNGNTTIGNNGSALSINGATTTAANGINLTTGCFSVDGTCVSLGGSGNSFGYLFPSNATSTTLTFSTGLLSLASTTIGNGNQNGGLTINGGATTTRQRVLRRQCRYRRGAQHQTNDPWNESRREHCGRELHPRRERFGHQPPPVRNVRELTVRRMDQHGLDGVSRSFSREPAATSASARLIRQPHSTSRAPPPPPACRSTATERSPVRSVSPAPRTSAAMSV